MHASPREPYADPERPATDINELLTYLTAAGDGRWLYRGQVKRYPGPLLPSGLRHILGNQPVIEASDPDAGKSLRHAGRRFIGNFPWDQEDYARAAAHRMSWVKSAHSSAAPATGPRGAEAYVSHFFGPDSPARLEKTPGLEELDALVDDSKISLALRTRDSGCDIPAEIVALARENCPRLRPDHPELVRYVNDRHRNLFLTKILINSVGFMAGSVIGQHYGFFSGMLDATIDLDVAAFFATHAAPDYVLVPPENARPPGVIYRFPRLDTSWTSERLLLTDYYEAPGTLVPEELLRALEAAVPPEDSIALMHTCFELRRAAEVGKRCYELLRFPADCVASSRVGRQHAGVIIPDEVQKGIDLGPRAHPIFAVPVIGPPNRQLCQQSVEDLHSRDGLTVYYFRHSGRPPRNELSPAYLWPREDFFLDAIAFLFLAGLNYYATPAFGLPVRLDLIDAGFGSLDLHALHTRGRRLVDTVVGRREPEEAVAGCLENTTERIMYLAFKAATLCRQGHGLGDAASLEASLRVVRKARKFDGSSCVLAALETVVLEALGRQHEIAESVGRLMKARMEGPDATVADEKFLDFYRKCLVSVYGWRYHPEFAWLVYELYQSF